MLHGISSYAACKFLEPGNRRSTECFDHFQITIPRFNRSCDAIPWNYNTVVFHTSCLQSDQCIHNFECGCREVNTVTEPGYIINGKLSFTIIEHAKSSGQFV